MLSEDVEQVESEFKSTVGKLPLRQYSFSNTYQNDTVEFYHLNKRSTIAFTGLFVFGFASCIVLRSKQFVPKQLKAKSTG